MKSTAPLQMLKRETVNQDYDAIYCLIPREQLPPKGDLLAVVDRLKTESENDYFNTHAAQAVIAVCQKQDFIVSNVFHRTCDEIHEKKPELRADLYLLLSAVCLTNSVSKLAGSIRPETILKKYYEGKQQLSETELQAFIKFCNNFIIELPGMRDLREAPENHIKFAIELIENPKKETRLNGFRLFMNICRALTARQIDDKLVDFTFNKLQELVKLQNDEKVALNLCCGAIGRICLTLQDEDPTRGQLLKQQLKKLLSQTPIEVIVPCGTALSKFAQPSRLPTAEDEMF